MVAGGAGNHADAPQGFPFGDAATARAYLDDYAARHRARLARDPRRGLAAQRLLVWDIKRVGLADRLLGLIASFLLALATDRTFLVEFGAPAADVSFLFSEPGWNWQTKLDTFAGFEGVPTSDRNGERVAYGGGGGGGGDAADDGDGTAAYTAMYVDFSWKVFLDDPHAAALLCDDVSRAWGDVDVLLVGSNEYYAPLLFSNPHHAPALARALGRRPFEAAARFLLRPARPLQAQIDAFMDAHYDAAWVAQRRRRRQQRQPAGGSAGTAHRPCPSSPKATAAPSSRSKIEW